MPSTSEKQKRLMAAVANNPKFAKEVGIPQSVGKEFQREDKKMNCGSKPKMAQGGMTGFKPCAACPNEAACAAKGKCMLKSKGRAKPTAMKKGGMMKYAAGGKLNMVKKGDKMVPDFAADGKGKMAYGGKVKAMKKGGKVRGCGMAKKGVRPAKMM